LEEHRPRPHPERPRGVVERPVDDQLLSGLAVARQADDLVVAALVVAVAARSRLVHMIATARSTASARAGSPSSRAAARAALGLSPRVNRRQVASASSVTCAFGIDSHPWNRRQRPP